MKKTSNLTVNLSNETFFNSRDVDIVDLAQDVEPTPYVSRAPRDYRKLHHLHTSAQSDKDIRLPKRKAQFSYASGKKPNLPFLDKDTNMADVFDSVNYEEDEEFPSPSALGPTVSAQNPSSEPFKFFALEEEKAATSSFPDNSLQTLEAGILELADNGKVEATSSKIDSNFANGIFDFDAFNDRVEISKKLEISPLRSDVLKNEPCSAQAKMNSLKRDRSATPELPEVKHLRLAKGEHVSEVAQAAVPNWVNDFDSELIDELKGYVDFVD